MTTLRKPKPKRRLLKGRKGVFILPGGIVVNHAPDDLCGGRRLVGKEFRARKAELEARDRKERALRAEFEIGSAGRSGPRPDGSSPAALLPPQGKLASPPRARPSVLPQRRHRTTAQEARP